MKIVVINPTSGAEEHILRSLAIYHKRLRQVHFVKWAHLAPEMFQWGEEHFQLITGDRFVIRAGDATHQEHMEIRHHAGRLKAQIVVAHPGDTWTFTAVELSETAKIRRLDQLEGTLCRSCWSHHSRAGWQISHPELTLAPPPTAPDHGVEPATKPKRKPYSYCRVHKLWHTSTQWEREHPN